MHRFSLRTQVFLLGGTFVAMLAAIAVTSWLVSNRLTESIYQSRLVVAQLKSLDDMKEDIEQGLADLLACPQVDQRPRRDASFHGARQGSSRYPRHRLFILRRRATCSRPRWWSRN